MKRIALIAAAFTVSAGVYIDDPAGSCNPIYLPTEQWTIGPMDVGGPGQYYGKPFEFDITDAFNRLQNYPNGVTYAAWSSGGEVGTNSNPVAPVSIPMAMNALLLAISILAFVRRKKR